MRSVTSQIFSTALEQPLPRDSETFPMATAHGFYELVTAKSYSSKKNKPVKRRWVSRKNRSNSLCVTKTEKSFLRDITIDDIGSEITPILRKMQKCTNNCHFNRGASFQTKLFRFNERNSTNIGLSITIYEGMSNFSNMCGIIFEGLREFFSINSTKSKNIMSLQVIAQIIEEQLRKLTNHVVVNTYLNTCITFKLSLNMQNQEITFLLKQKMYLILQAQFLDVSTC